VEWETVSDNFVVICPLIQEITKSTKCFHAGQQINPLGVPISKFLI
jgi:hypothetical protein